MTRPPNIIYFICHDLGRGLGSYGAGIPTPHLDAFARDGVRFTNAHCASPACSPSRACAMSGLYAHTSGVLGLSHMGWPLDLKWRTTVDDFNAAGYQTILSGINHERHPRTDRYQVDLNRDWEDWKLPRVVNNALSALEKRDASRPFYLNIGTQEPHFCMWGTVGVSIPPMPDEWPSWMPPGMPSTPAMELAFRRFAASVVQLDNGFGALMEGLDRLGLRDNTLVVFTTDHGMVGPRGKGSLYGLGTEIALLLRWPQVLRAGGLREAPISNIGFRATLAAAAGIPLTSEPQGTSFWDYAVSGNTLAEDAIFLERNFHGEKPWRKEPDYVDCYDPLRAIRTSRHLYIRNYSPGAKPDEPRQDIRPIGSPDWKEWNSSWELPQGFRASEELYDLAADPYELINRAALPEFQAVKSQLADQLTDWMTRTRDFLPDGPPQRLDKPGWGNQWLD